METTLKFILKFVNVQAVLAVFGEYLRKQAVKLPEIVKDWIAYLALDVFNDDPAAVSARVASCAAALKSKGK